MSEQALLYLGIGLLAMAMLLIVVEAFIPSGGVIGAVSLIVAIGGIVALFRSDTRWGVAGMLVTVVLGPMVFFFALSMLPSTPFGRSLIGAPSDEEIARREEAERAMQERYHAMVGLEGVAITELRPVGEAKFGSERYEVLAEGGLIEAGTPVRITRAEPSMIKVRAVRDS
jgi:membrane-bound ClpP family serine protease